MWIDSGFELTDAHDLTHLGDCHARGRRHQRVEVACRAPVPEVAELVGPRRVDERDVRVDRPLEHVRDAVDDALLLPLREERARANRCEEARDPGPGGADRLGERSLRDEGRLDLARIDGSHCLRVRREVGGDAALDPSLAEELPEPAAGLADVVRDDRQLIDIGALHEGVDERERCARRARSHRPSPCRRSGSPILRPRVGPCSSMPSRRTLAL